MAFEFLTLIIFKLNLSFLSFFFNHEYTLSLSVLYGNARIVSELFDTVIAVYLYVERSLTNILYKHSYANMLMKNLVVIFSVLRTNLIILVYSSHLNTPVRIYFILSLSSLFNAFYFK